MIEMLYTFLEKKDIFKDLHKMFFSIKKWILHGIFPSKKWAIDFLKTLLPIFTKRHPSICARRLSRKFPQAFLNENWEGALTRHGKLFHSVLGCDFKAEGSLNGDPCFGGINLDAKIYGMAILRDFCYNSTLFGLVI